MSTNETQRQAWLKAVLGGLPTGTRLLDAGAGELGNRRHCAHLEYVSQDFCAYKGAEAGAAEGLLDPAWDTSHIDLVSDITAIPASDRSFDAILCTEVLEHVPDPLAALDEFARLLRPGGEVILTAPFASMVHQAPFFFQSGFSRFWYEHHLTSRGFEIVELVPNGDWLALIDQEVGRHWVLQREAGHFTWPLSYVVGRLMRSWLRLTGGPGREDLACFGWHCRARLVRLPNQA